MLFPVFWPVFPVFDPVLVVLPVFPVFDPEFPVFGSVLLVFGLVFGWFWAVLPPTGEPDGWFPPSDGWFVPDELPPSVLLVPWDELVVVPPPWGCPEVPLSWLFDLLPELFCPSLFSFEFPPPLLLSDELFTLFPNAFPALWELTVLIELVTDIVAAAVTLVSVEIMLLVIIVFVFVCVSVFRPWHGCDDAADTVYIHDENVPFWKSAWVNVFDTP